MSNYSQTTFFTPKDSLLSGNPAKLIVGAAYDVEFGNIATAIATKPDNLTTSSFLNVNVTGSAVPVNGIYLPATNTLGFASNTTQRATVNSTGNWVVNAPSSGIPLTVAGLSGNATIQVNTADGHAALFANGPAATQITGLLFTQSGQSSWQFYQPASSSDFRIFGNSADRFVITSAGNVTINVPSSGTTLGLAGAANAYTLSLTANSTSGQSLGLRVFAGTTSGDAAVFVQNQAANTTFFEIFGDGHGTLGANGTQALAWTAAGAFSIAAPSSSATTLTLTAIANSYAETINGSSTSGQSYGTQILAGTTSADQALYVASQSNTKFLVIYGDGEHLITQPGAATNQGSPYWQIGYLDEPQNLQNAAYQLVLTDRGKQLYHTSASAHTYTIPANSSVAFPIGTIIRIINAPGTGNLTIAITTDALHWFPSNTTGSRTLAASGACTIEKIDATNWIITGVNLS